MTLNTIWEVLEYGPIVAQDEDWQALITINGSCMNLWVARAPGCYECAEVRTPGHQGLCSLTASQAMELGEAWLKELKSEWEEETR